MLWLTVTKHLGLLCAQFAWRSGIVPTRDRFNKRNGFFSSQLGDKKIYQLLYNASSLTGFIIWLGIAICHLRFRKAGVAQGRSLDDLKFKSKFFPYGPWLPLILFVVVLFCANIGVFQTPVFSWFDFITDY